MLLPRGLSVLLTAAAAMIVIAGLPIAAILLALVNWQVALGFMVVWSAGLLFGVRQQHCNRQRVA